MGGETRKRIGFTFMTRKLSFTHHITDSVLTGYFKITDIGYKNRQS
jgi:hypothetical protein